MILETSTIYKKNIIALRLAYEKPTAFALCASVLDLVAFVRFALFKTNALYNSINGLKNNQLRYLELRRKLPVTRTLFPWHSTLQFSLTRDLEKELGIEK
ncbi:putative F-actin-capping protein subunit alpha [Helianthus anomalus]